MNCDRLRAWSQRRNASSSKVGLNPVYWMLSAEPGEDFAGGVSCTMGPLLRRGTISVAAGTPSAAVAVTSLPPSLYRNFSGIGMTCSRLPWKTVDRLLGEDGSVTTFSR